MSINEDGYMGNEGQDYCEEYILKVLITGGCGFIGSNLAVAFRRVGWDVACIDNLSRRGSERLLVRVKASGAQFVHGDVRCSEDLVRLGDGFDLMVECSAEPSVLVGARGDEARFMVNNNLVSAMNCMEWARENRTGVIFLSTSRVYPYTQLNNQSYREDKTRFTPAEQGIGFSELGIGKAFPLEGRRSLYGATKLAGELLLQEYSANYGIPAIINRCGVVAGPWQLGKVDQGVFTFWLASHFFGRTLKYIGFGGKGKQVRDLLHVNDLCRLVLTQAERIGEFRGEVFHAGGGALANCSLQEATTLCREITGREVPIGIDLEDRLADVIWYVTNNEDTEKIFGWKPQCDAHRILQDIHEWLVSHEMEFRDIFDAVW